MKLTPTKRIKEKISKVFHWPKTAFISERTARLWPKTMKKFNFRIPSQLSPADYRRFVQNYKPRKIGPFSLHFSKGSIDGAMIFTLSKREDRIITQGNKKLLKSSGLTNLARTIRLKLKNRMCKVKFFLTRTIEPELTLPINRASGAGICAITNLIGPTSRKYEGTQAIVQQINETIGTNWQNFLLTEISNHAKSQGCSAVALLRPENNPDLTNRHLSKTGVDLKGAESIRSQYYAAARKAGFKKVEGSNYFWRIF